MSELHKCEQCGSNCGIQSSSTGHWYRCYNCDLVPLRKPTEEEAVEAWNTLQNEIRAGRAAISATSTTPNTEKAAKPDPLAVLGRLSQAAGRFTAAWEIGGIAEMIRALDVVRAEAEQVLKAHQ